jgi:hypothetical protein
MTQYFVRLTIIGKLALVAALATFSLASSCVMAQTTRTNPSASSTIKSIPSSSSTSPNSPCNPTNPTSPCYSANAPRDPCYSALAPNEPCSTTTTPPPQTLPQTSTRASPNPQSSTGSPFTTDQAISRIEAAGYSNVSGLRKDAKGVWRGNAVRDTSTVNVTLDVDGKVSAK